MSNPKAIIIHPAGSGFQISIPGDALRIKQDALAKSAAVLTVANGDEQTTAIRAAATLKGIAAETEKLREEIKRPYLDAGRAIDAKAKEYVAELNAESKRLERLVADFQQAEQEKRAAAEREAQRQRDEAERAAQAERDKLAEIERQRVAAEQAAANAKTKKAREAAAAEAERLRLEAAETELAAAEAQDDAASAASVTVVMAPTPAATGAATSFVTEFEVTDIDALYAWDLARRTKLAAAYGKPLANFPSIFKMELKKADFKFVTQSLDDADRDTIPGVNFTKTAKVAVRSANPFNS